MEGMRDILKDVLGRSLSALTPLDRLAAAWPVVCGRTLAERGTVSSYEEGVLTIDVAGHPWMQQFLSMRPQLAGQLARIARVPVTEIHFQEKRIQSR